MEITICKVGEFLSYYIIFFTIIIVAAILQTSSGYGFSIIATPFLLFIFNLIDAIQINLLISLCLSITLLRSIWDDTDFKLVKQLIWSSIVGLPIGIFILLYLEVQLFKISIGIVLFILTILLICRWSVTQTTGKTYVTGSLSGMFTTAFGMPGPPLLVYFASTQMSKETLRATTLVFYLWIYFISFIIQWITVGVTKHVWISTAQAIPFLVIGLMIGQYIFTKMNSSIFKWMTYNI